MSLNKSKCWYSTIVYIFQSMLFHFTTLYFLDKFKWLKCICRRYTNHPQWMTSPRNVSNQTARWSSVIRERASTWQSVCSTEGMLFPKMSMLLLLQSRPANQFSLWTGVLLVSRYFSSMFPNLGLNLLLFSWLELWRPFQGAFIEMKVNWQ